jgi:hypothetical protein
MFGSTRGLRSVPWWRASRVETRPVSLTGGADASGSSNSLRQQGIWISPFPVSPSGGKPGRAGSPHAAKSGRLPPQEGFQSAPLKPPLCIPPVAFREVGTQASRFGEVWKARSGNETLPRWR